MPQRIPIVAAFAVALIFTAAASAWAKVSPSANADLTIIGWNVESGGADATTIAGQLAALYLPVLSAPERVVVIATSTPTATATATNTPTRTPTATPTATATKQAANCSRGAATTRDLNSHMT